MPAQFFLEHRSLPAKAPKKNADVAPAEGNHRIISPKLCVPI
jgi:hypothetical protein